MKSDRLVGRGSDLVHFSDFFLAPDIERKGMRIKGGRSRALSGFERVPNYTDPLVRTWKILQWKRRVPLGKTDDGRVSASDDGTATAHWYSDA